MALGRHGNYQLSEHHWGSVLQQDRPDLSNCIHTGGSRTSLSVGRMASRRDASDDVREFVSASVKNDLLTACNAMAKLAALVDNRQVTKARE